MSDPKPKVRQIVFERKPFRWGRFLLFTGGGLLIGVIFAVAFYLIMKRTAGGEVPDALYTKECCRYVCASIFLCLVAGLLGGWAWDRSVEPRIEMVDIPWERRSPRTSTALVRVEASRRSRF